MEIKHRLEYGKFDDLRKIKIDEEETEIKGVKNYVLKHNYAPILDRKYLDKFNPEKTNISVCGNAPFKFDKDKLIKNVIEEVKNIKDYYIRNTHEHIAEFSLFQNIDIEGFMLESYGFYLDQEGEYSLILWFTPTYLFNHVRQHIYWYKEKLNQEWY